jgi:hypothetical protein
MDSYELHMTRIDTKDNYRLMQREPSIKHQLFPTQGAPPEMDSS